MPKRWRWPKRARRRGRDRSTPRWSPARTAASAARLRRPADRGRRGAVVAALEDPDPRTAGAASSGCAPPASRSRSARRRSGGALDGRLPHPLSARPPVRHAEARLSIDGKIALPSGESRWITGEDARAHVHLERARADMILVGRGTYDADRRASTCACPGWRTARPAAPCSPAAKAVEGWDPARLAAGRVRLHDVNDLLVEGGSGAATAFLTADLVDRMLIYRAPIIIGEGKSSVGYIGLTAIADAHGRWRWRRRALGIDRLEVYERVARAAAGDKRSEVRLRSS
jgi:diaminohydroxyphosphoribosylaminopyrimidine deaminase/5-amino-6-(5-phosphoribosylamino)uracil reductase